MKLRLLYPLFAFLIVGLSAGLIYYARQYYKPVSNFNPKKFEVNGIDVSAHNGSINWLLIKADKIDFVFIKATEGKTFRDKRFRANLSGARKAGIKAGAYHFFRFNRSGQEQAKNFLSTVNLKELDLPPVLDVEDWGNHFHNRSNWQVRKEIGEFIRYIENKNGKKVIIYTSGTAYKKYIRANFSRNPLWIASLGHRPYMGNAWTFWQYSSKGRLKGTHGDVDLNTFNGNRAQWYLYLKNN